MTATVQAPRVPRSSAPAPAPPGRALRRLVRGRAGDPAWVRPGVLALLTGTAVLYLWDLAASGWANAYYSAAVQAGSQNWTAFFYGSSDAANSITVDKPPLSLWVMALSVRLFGLSSWSILVPQALMGVATVGVLYLAVRRVAGPGAGLLAGTAMALTPVAVLMFRFNNPDALLVLLLTLAAYALSRAVERGGARWPALVGVLVGLAFLTKMLQALLVVPALALVYLVAAPTSLRRRLLHLLGAGLALVVSGGWWVAVVELVPSSMRPWIGGSQTDSVWELIWGYNGLGRLTGEEIGSIGGAPGGGWGQTGLARLFDAENGGQVAWLLPAALVLLGAGLVAVGRAPRTDRRRAALLLWGGWLLVTGLVFSLMAGIFHAYYTVALAPAIAALVGIGGALLWQRRDRAWARTVLAVCVAGTGLWSWVLLSRSAEFLPWLKWLVLVGGVLAAVGLLLPWARRTVVVTVLTIGLLAGLAGPAAYAVHTAATAHTGAIPSAGPTVAGAGPGGVLVGVPGAGAPGGAVGQAPPNGPGAFPGGPTPTGAVAPPAGPGRGGGGMAGLLDATDAGAELVDALSEDASSYTWAAATVGANNAAGYQLATGLPVMPIGGFNGTDPSPTLAEFQRYVAEGKIHWFIGDGGEMPGGMPADGSARAGGIASWVAATFESRTIDGVTLYDLSRPLD
ncbi:MAG TPA: glycosyltransferase family 39 protein [Geodermatophilus sp.]|nr:glycosyltransferase family 39 protein [Geodermatophilus sp.]